MQFKKGDVITAIERGMGFEEATVESIVELNGKHFYKLKIMCGTATIPESAERNYKLVKKKKL